MKNILIVRFPLAQPAIDPKWFDGLQNDYHVFIIGQYDIDEIKFEYPKNCNLQESDLEKIKEAILIK